MKAIERVYRLLSIRDRSEKEIRDYFKIQNFKLKMKNKDLITQSEIDELIKNLKEKDLINDERFAQNWTESRARKYGKVRIKQELAQKGIKDFDIEIENPELTAEKLLERKMKSWQDLGEEKQRKKAMDFLMRRGFEFDIVKSVVEKLIKKVYNTNEW